MSFYQKKSLPPIKFQTSENETILAEIEDIPNLCCQYFDIFNIASTFFELEKIVLLGEKINSVTIPITETTYNKINLEKAILILENLSVFTLEKNVEFKFEPFPFYQSTLGKLPEEYDAICLFSGGADSFAGILEATKIYNRVLGLYIHHKSSNRLLGTVKKIKKQLREEEHINIESIQVNSQVKEGYSQTRGLLYLICGGIYAKMYNSSTLVLSECGVTIYQPSFGELDKTTFTSHPVIQQASKDLLKLFLQIDIELLTPFENNTKSEMFALSEKKELLKITHSCISSRYGKNDGVCYGCLIRRIGFIVANVEDCKYMNDIFSLKKKETLNGYPNTETSNRINDFLELMKFSLDILVDYDNMEYSKRKKIDTFGKYDLFRRFSLDTFAALYIIIEEKNTNVNARIKKKYFDSMHYIDKKLIINRISEVRKLKE